MNVVYPKIENDQEIIEFLPHLMERNKLYYGSLSNGMTFVFQRDDDDNIISMLQVSIISKDIIDGKPHQLRQFTMKNN